MGKTAFLFPGQGAQSLGMGKSLYDASSAAREIFLKANAILGYSISDLCFDGPAEELDSTVISQPAIFTLSIAMLEALRDGQPELVDLCDGTAGLSLGEYTALVFAGAMSFEDGLRLVQKRGRAMQDASDATPSGMVSIIGMELPEVETLCEQLRGNGVLQVANILCPGNIVISGTQNACERVAEQSAAGKFRAVPLAVAGAFHTPIMKPADDVLRKVLDETKISTPKIPVFSNVDTEPHFEPDDIRATLVRQILSPVLWEKTIRKLIELGYDDFYEIGPGRVLRGLIKRIDRKIKCSGVFE